MKLDEAEIQLLASIYRAADAGESTDRDSLEQSGERFWIYREDWTPAYASLIDKMLIEGDDTGYRLSASGAPLAREYNAERPDRYWYYYRQFYSRANRSTAHSRLCERVFGIDLCQEGQMDMAAVDDLLQRLELGPGRHLLDLGCGAGGVSEYLADQTGARVTGLDYSPDAIAVASARTRDKRAQLDFIQADLNDLQLPAGCYDAAVMIDTIYWAADTAQTLRWIIDSLKPGGRLVIVIARRMDNCETPEDLEIDRTFVARALDEIGADYQSVDVTEPFIDFWLRQKQALDDLRDDYIAEGNEFIYLSLNTEAETEFLPAIEAGSLRRYLYLVQR